ncbi:S8 family serine peptidase [Lactobacillus crispatus]|uniref:S8 family serine peptidase n=1 Tax=Lactobacillus crispatus TaxID=47770 RepID=UPI000B5D9721|nr:S8 family serine peptidase [Lactobacillus crispatus]OXC24452.1 peptidase S8 [Lactobacillus crispatus]OXC32950.1 peptidase S8 [Lactobacillus crispatus]OXC35314.1 peptidase S8 [Lactobacillus crispatus]
MKRNKYAGVLVCAATLSVVSVFATAEQQVKASVESQTKTVAKSTQAAESATTGLTNKAIEAQLAAKGVNLKHLTPKQKQDVYVDVIVQLSAAPAATNGSVSANSSSAEIEQASKEVIANQASIKEKVKAITNQAIGKSYGYVVNGFATKAKVKDIQKLRNIPGVKSVTLAKVYYANDSSADDMANVSTVWNNYKYKGEGTVVSIIDTGIDPNHKDLRLSDDSKAKLTKDKVNAFTKETGYGRYFTDKVPYGHNYSDNNDNITDDNPSEQHGMHVAGIVAANGTAANSVNSVVGVAPEAQLLAMKAFSNSDSSASTDSTSIIGAIDDSAKLGADVLNMSLGSVSGQQNEDDPEVAAVERATKKGTAAVISAGNSGTSNSETEGVNKAYYGNPDMETLGSPGTARSATTVASAENTKATTDGVTITSADGKTTIVNPEATQLSEGTDRAFFNDKKFYVVKDKNGKLGTGAAKQYTSAVKGKIAIVKRGDLTFTDKQKYAQEAGAAGLIIVNNKPGDMTGMSLTAGFPTAGLSASAGEELVKYVEKHPDEALKVSIVVQALNNSARQTDLMSDFTSYGPASNLAFKPDISAPGGHIWSTQNNNGYTNMSGTSMASPFIAGTQALVSQTMNDKNGAFYTTYQKMSPEERTAFIKTLEMNTASIQPDISHDNVIVSPRRQGAGFINAQATIQALAKNPSTVVSSDGYPGVELKSFKNRNLKFQVKFTNRTNKPLTYKLENNGKDSDVYTSATDGSAVLYDKKIDGASIKASGDVVVPANSTKELTLTLTLPANFNENQYVEGFLTFNGSDSSQLRLPYMGFFGDWASSDLPIFASLNDPDVFQPDNNMFGTLVTVGNSADNTNPGLSRDASGNLRFDPSKFAISNAKNAQYKWFKPTYYLYRNANNVKIQILDKNGKVINTLASLSNATKTYYESQEQSYTYFNDAPSWDGTYFDQQANKTVNAPDGNYTYRISATVNGTNTEQHYDIPVKVDSVAPVVKNLKLESSKIKDNKGQEQTRYYLSAEAKDELSGLSGEVNVSVNGVSSQLEYDPTVKADKDGFKKVEIDLSPAQVKALQAGTNSFSVALFDNAANAGTTSGEGNKPGETSFGLVLRNGGLPDKISSQTKNYNAKSGTYVFSGTYPSKVYGTYTDKDGHTHDFSVESDDNKLFTAELPLSQDDYKTTIALYADSDHKTLLKKQDITVSLVPAKVESLSVDKNDTYDVTKDKSATLAQTSESTAKLSGKVSADTKTLVIKQKGQKDVPVELNADHTFSTELPVSFGENSFTLVATDADGNSSSVVQTIKSSDRGKTTVSSSDVTFNNGIKWGTRNVNAKTKNYNPKTGKLILTGKVKRPTTTLQIGGKNVKINSDQTFRVVLNIGTHGAKIFSALIGDSTVRETTQERLSFYVDAEAPTLNLDSENTVYTNKGKFTISGTVSDDYKFYDLSINGNDVETSWSDVDYNSKEGIKKNFKHEVDLKKGKNTFNVKVTDSQGNSSSQALVVYYEPAKTLAEPSVEQVVAKDGKSATLKATTDEAEAKVVYSIDNGKTFNDVPVDGFKLTKNGTVQFKTVDKYGNESKIKSVEVKDLNQETKPSEDEDLAKAKEDLQAKVNAGEKKDLSKFTDESKKNFNEALKKAEDVLADKNAKLSDLQDAAKALDKAEQALAEKPAEPSKDDNKPSEDKELAKAKEDLQTKVDAGKKKDLDKYTDESKKNFNEALKKAKDVLADKNAKLSDLQDAAKDLDKAEQALAEKSTQPSTPLLPGNNNTASSSNQLWGNQTVTPAHDEKDTKKNDNKSTTEDGKDTKVMFKSTLYTKDLKKTKSSAKAYSFLNLVTEEGKLKVYTFSGQHFYKIVGQDAYIRVRNVTGTKVTLKRNSFVYQSNGKKASHKLLKKGTTITVYGDQYKALKHYKKYAYRVGESKYIKSVNINKVNLVK